MDSSDRQRALPFWLLLLAAAVVLVIGLWVHPLGRSGGGGEDSPPSMNGGLAALRQVEELSQQLTEETAPASERQRQPRESYTFIRPGRRGPDIAPDSDFPATQDLRTSSTLEIAQEQGNGHVIGWVSDVRGAPLEGAKVTLEWAGTVPEGEDAPRMATASSANGIFQLMEVTPGNWSLMAEQEGFAKAVVANVGIQSGKRTGPLELRLQPELELKLEVASTKKPVAGATVEAWRNHLAVRGTGSAVPVSIQYATATTDEKGKVTINQLPPGPVRVRVKAPGLASAEAAVDLRKDHPPLKIDLQPEAIIAGIVRDEFGNLIEGAELELRVPEAAANAPPAAMTKSGGGGAFRFSQLPQATPYHLFASAPRYARAGPVPVITGSTQTVVILTSGGAIEGVVTNFESGQPVANMGVVARAKGAESLPALWTRTNTTGRYRITRLPAGVYDVAILSERFTSEPRLDVAVEAEKLVKDQDFSVYPGIRIDGTVIDGDTGERLIGATVELESRVGPGFLLAKKTTTRTDEAGVFRFENLPQGIYTLAGSMEGFMRGPDEEAAVRIELVHGQLAEPVEIKLYRGGVIEGAVVDGEGNPVNEAAIQLFHAGGTPSKIKNRDFNAVTNVNGTFIIEGIPIHNEVHLYASATAPNLPKGRSDRLVLSRSQPVKRAPIILPFPASLSVLVRTPSGEGISAANVDLNHHDFGGDLKPEEWKGTTDTNGGIQFQNLPPGRARVSANAEGFLGASVNADLEAFEAAEVEIVLQPAYELAGRVEDDRLEPVRKGSVRARGESGAQGGGSAGLDEEGKFRLTSLGQGRFTLEADARKPAPTGEHRIIWSFPSIEVNEGNSQVVLAVPSSGVLVGQVQAPDSASPPDNYHVSITGKYTDDAGNGRTFRASHTFRADDEEFRFEALPPGEYSVSASAADFLPVEAGPFEVVSPGEVSAGVLYLEAGGALRFTAVDDETGEPIAGVRAQLSGEGPGGKTNGKGEARLSRIPPGIYTLSLSHEQHLSSERELIMVSAGKETDLGEVEMERGGVLFGEVKDASNEPLRGAEIEARALETGEVKKARTDAGGRYTLRGLNVGSHVVTYSATLRERRVSKSYDLAVTRGQETRQDVVLRAESTLIGYLRASSDVDVNRAVVTLYPLRINDTPVVDDPLEVPEVTGSRFVMEGLSDGSYLVCVQAPRLGEGEPAHWSDVAQVSFPQSTVFVNQGQRVLRGRILDGPNGRPLPSQEVRLELLTAPESGLGQLRRWWQWSAMTDENGRFVLFNLPSGTFSLTAHNEDLQADVLEIVSLTGMRTSVEQDFVLEANNGRPPTGGGAP